MTAILLLPLLSLSLYILWAFLQFRLAKKAELSNAWMAFIPLLNTFQLFQLAKISLWWILGLFVPFLNIGIMIWIVLRIAYNFGEKKGFGILLFTPPLCFWALWKLGKTAQGSLSPDDQETVNEIKGALAAGYTKEMIAAQAVKEGLPVEKVEYLFAQIDANIAEKQTSTGAIIGLFILSTILWSAAMALLLFFIFSSVFFLIFGEFMPPQTNEVPSNIQNELPVEIPIATEAKTEPVIYNEAIDLEIATIEFAQLPKKIVKNYYGTPETFWEFAYRIKNKTDKKYTIKASLTASQSESVLKAKEESINSINFSIANINKIDIGEQTINIKFYECETEECKNSSEEETPITKEFSQRFWFSGLEEPPRFVTEDEAKELNEAFALSEKEAIEKELFYEIKMISDNELLMSSPDVDLLKEARSMVIIVNNNDTFGTGGAQAICEFTPKTDDSFLLKDTIFSDDFDNHHAFLQKEFPENSITADLNGNGTCKIMAKCPATKDSLDPRSRFCEKDTYAKSTEVTIFTQNFSFEVDEKGNITVEEVVETAKKSKPRRRPKRATKETVEDDKTPVEENTTEIKEEPQTDSAEANSEEIEEVTEEDLSETESLKEEPLLIDTETLSKEENTNLPSLTEEDVKTTDN